MSYRQLMILKKSHLCVENNNIKVKYDNTYNLIPSEDVGIIIVDNLECTFTTPFFNECSEKGIVVLICGKKHVPSIQALPTYVHYRLAGVLDMQIKQSDRLKEEATEQLLKAKLMNQKEVLKLIDTDKDIIDLFDTYIDEIEGHDDKNREGTAARLFFGTLYSREYARFESDPINNCQNYGYAILSACISRNLCALGLNLSLGVNHYGQNNPFNLTYDIIEPFRPLIDYYIYSNRSYLTDELNVQTKKELVNILNLKIISNDKVVTVQYAIEILCKSYLRFLEYEGGDLDLPTIMEIDFLKENEHI